MNIDLKYGCNPHQTLASLGLPDPSPLQILNGQPSYINILDALGAWQLAHELKGSTGVSAAASFKHTSPAGAAIARPISDDFRVSQFLREDDLSPIATAYVRARGGDRMCSFGDAVGASDVVDMSLAQVLKREVSDLIIAPSYDKDALEVLMQKKKGNYIILSIDPDYQPPDIETRELYGISLRQKRNDLMVSSDHFKNVVTKNKSLPENARDTLIVATVALKYTQSNSVCVAYDGQVIGMGAGQQSRIHCTRLACDKADKWFMQQHPNVLGLPFQDGISKTEKANLVDQFLLSDQLSERERTIMMRGLAEKPAVPTAADKIRWISKFDGVCLSSDAYIPFRDNIDRANRSNVGYVAQTGSSTRDDEVTLAADEYGITMVHTGLRCFLH